MISMRTPASVLLIAASLVAVPAAAQWTEIVPMNPGQAPAPAAGGNTGINSVITPGQGVAPIPQGQMPSWRPPAEPQLQAPQQPQIAEAPQFQAPQFQAPQFQAPQQFQAPAMP